ncbi:hypothetical protein WUBG_19205 [Wuchereria bancrofti]|uniref:Uncharacterized protein n=1 Tax=Wuchereria bancrofti TaxID=6293 RepID=J9DJU9_WUCBA|nr:hypothetical protein WUBG_19205 [Wuchereria bancrofti]
MTFNFNVKNRIDYPLVIPNCLTPMPQMPVSVLPEMSTAWNGNICLATSATTASKRFSQSDEIIAPFNPMNQFSRPKSRQFFIQSEGFP